MNKNLQFEIRLLKQCAENNLGAQKQFTFLKYPQRVYRTASELNRHYNNPLHQEELSALCKLWIVEIYAAYATLPHPQYDLYEQIDQYVFGRFLEYIQVDGLDHRY